MSGVITYLVLLGGAFGLALGMFFSLRAAKII